MLLAEKLVRLRKENKMSQLDLAEKLNVSRQAVSRWEAGDSKPSIENIQYLSDLYGVSLESLLNESKECAEKILEPESDRSRKRLKLLSIVSIFIVLAVCITLVIFIISNQGILDLRDIPGEEMELIPKNSFDVEW